MCTKCQYVSSLPDGQSILNSNSRTRCKYVAVFLRPVNDVLIMLLITYFTTDRLILSTFVLSDVPGWRKWPVDPASAIPNSLLIWIVLAPLFAVSTVLEQFLMVNVMPSSSLVANAAY